MRLLLLLAAVAALLATLAWASAGTARAQTPEIIFNFPREGDVLAEPPLVLQMCFKEPINIRDLDKGGDFRFRLVPPHGVPLGMRIVFQTDGYGVAIYPGTAVGTTEGTWTFDYRVTSAETLEPLEGTITFEVAEGGEPILQPEPPPCTPTGPADRTPEVVSPGTSPGQGTPVEGGDSGGDDSGPDVLLLSLLTVAAAGGAAVIGLLAYVFRNRIGFWFHRPPAEGEGGGEAGSH